ncbi:hypothetical protein [Nostoc sp.]|uniref:hypothetical protein n=1 Tax=Nostoc sp. TaxID=1180 RepID=UPI002FF774A1
MIFPGLAVVGVSLYWFNLDYAALIKAERYVENLVEVGKVNDRQLESAYHRTHIHRINRPLARMQNYPQPLTPSAILGRRGGNFKVPLPSLGEGLKVRAFDSCKRSNVFADGTWGLLKGVIAALGIHGLVTIKQNLQ